MGHLMMEGQIEWILIDRRQHSSVLDVRSFKVEDCDTGHYLVVKKVRERLAVSKHRLLRFHIERFSSNKVNEIEVKSTSVITYTYHDLTISN
jgi:hypothetical protein